MSAMLHDNSLYVVGLAILQPPFLPRSRAIFLPLIKVHYWYKPVKIVKALMVISNSSVYIIYDAVIFLESYYSDFESFHVVLPVCLRAAC